MTGSLSIGEARRIALASQGFDRPRPAGRVTLDHVRRVIHRLGLIQIDPVNVLIPAHYQVLFSRLGPYDRTLLDTLIYRKREFTEQWAHEASIVPVESWPLLHYRRESHRVRPWGFETFLAENGEYVESVLEHVRTRGASTAEDLPWPEGTSRKVRDEPWFGTVPRAVLEAHFGRGALAVAERKPNFARAFDLAERLIPAQHHERRVDQPEAQRELLAKAARAHGIGTMKDLADYYRMPVREASPRIAELVESGEVRPLKVEGWGMPAYLHSEARIPKRIDAASLLSPFDPVIWYRPRVESLFDFHYRIEIYLPEPQRRWGYYVLPFLLGDRLVGRVDLKADRQNGRLLVPNAYIEPYADAEEVAPALAVELRAWANWLNLGSVSVTGRAGFAGVLKKALKLNC
jgi:uncharacterized protein YcaQ